MSVILGRFVLSQVSLDFSVVLIRDTFLGLDGLQIQNTNCVVI